MTRSPPPARVVADHGPGRRRTLLLGALGALLIAGSAPLVAASGTAPTTSALFRCAYAVPVLWALRRRERRQVGERPWRERRWPMAAGLCFAADLGLWHQSIDAVGAGLATVLANSQVVIVGLVAWALLGERPRRSVLWGVPVVMVGIVLIAGVTSDGYGQDPVAGTLYGIGAAVAYSGFLLLLRRGGQDGRPVGALLDATAVAAIVLLVVGLPLDAVDVVPSWPAHGWLLLLALTSQVVAWLLISTTLPRLPAVATSVLLLVQPVGSLLIGVLLLGEEPSSAQLLGTVVVLVGVAVATLPDARSGRASGRAADRAH